MLKITARQLRELLEPVIPLALNDDMLPVLTCIQFRSHGRTVTASATDRFRLGISRIELEQSADFTALLRVRDLRKVMTLFKANRLDNPALTFVRSGDVVTVSSDEAFAGMHGASLSLTIQAGQFPELGELITKALKDSAGDGGLIGVNPEFLGSFKAAVHRGESLVVKPGSEPMNPILVASGEHFVGLLMPRKLMVGTNAEYLADLQARWAPVLKKPARKRAPAKKAATKAPAKKAAARKASASA